MTDEHEPAAQQSAPAGRRAAAASRRRVDSTLVLAVVVPLVTAGLAWGVRTHQVRAETSEPELAVLDRADRGCPAPRSGGTVLVASVAGDQAGEVELRAIDRDRPPATLAVGSGAVATTAAQGPLLVTGVDAMAPGLLSAISTDQDPAFAPCPAPQPDVWFTGLGARAEHASVIQLVNPDVGAAVVDVALATKQGPLEADDLRGIRVPGRTSLRLDLSAMVPRRGDIAAHVQVSRGRLSALVLDRVTRLGADLDGTAWLAGQPAAATRSLLLGLPSGPGRRSLALANPGTDEARVSIRVVATESTFAPAGEEEIRVKPGALVTVRLDKVLAREARRGALGLQIEADVPVTASLSTFGDGGLALSGAATTVADEAATILPAGAAQLLLAGAASTGLATVTSRDRSGAELGREQVELRPGLAATVDLPSDTAVVVVTVERTTVSGAVLVTTPVPGKAPGTYAVVVPLVVPERSRPVPGVTPAGRLTR